MGEKKLGTDSFVKLSMKIITLRMPNEGIHLTEHLCKAYVEYILNETLVGNPTIGGSID